MYKEIEKFIEEHPDWSVSEGKLVADFKFSDFSGVQNLVSKIMAMADNQNHHPEVKFGYCSVEVKTVTHDEDDSITEKDFSLARMISEVASE